MRSTFKLLFYINRQKTKKNGRCPIMGRVTIDGKMTQYTTGLEIEPDLWNPETGRAMSGGKRLENLPPEAKDEVRKLNIHLDGLEEKAKKAYNEKVEEIGYVSAELIKNVKKLWYVPLS